MRIISKYSDYYDSVMGTAYDPTLIYKREGALDTPIVTDVHYEGADLYSVTKSRTEMSTYFGKVLNIVYLGYGYGYDRRREKTLQVSLRILENAFKNSLARGFRHATSGTHIIGFCGKFYVTHRFGYYGPDEIRREYFVTSMDDRLIQGLDKKDRDVIIAGEVSDLILGNADDIFLRLDCPIFHIEQIRYANRIRIIRNPILKDLGFPAILDPYTAYQELSMYMGSVFAPSEPDMVGISDKDMSESKGFDNWSFRRMPTKHKRN